MASLVLILASLVAVAFATTDVLLPLYVYPSNGAREPVYAAVSANPSVEFLFVVNPDSGPGADAYPNSDYTTGLAKLNACSKVKTIWLRSYDVRKRLDFGHCKEYHKVLLEEALSRRCCFADKDDALDTMHDIAAAGVAEEKRGRVLVISNLPESEGALASKRQQSDENKVEKLLDALDVQCRPMAVYRVGRPAASNAGGNKRSRFTFVELPHQSIATECLKRKQRLRKCTRFQGHDFSHVYVERAMSKQEQEQAYRDRMQRRSTQQDQAYRERVQQRAVEKPDSSNAPSTRTQRWDVQPEHFGNPKNVAGTVPPSV